MRKKNYIHLWWISIYKVCCLKVGTICPSVTTVTSYNMNKKIRSVTGSKDEPTILHLSSRINHHHHCDYPHYHHNHHHHCHPQIRSVAQSCLTLYDPMNRSMPGLPVHHQLPEFTQTQVHRVSDAIQPSHPLSSPSPLAPNPSQHQSLFQWVNSSHEVASAQPSSQSNSHIHTWPQEKPLPWLDGPLLAK